MTKRKNISLILGLSIPVLMILFIIASIYWPKTTIHPKFNFLYLIAENYNKYSDNNVRYIIQAGKLVTTKKATENTARFFIYDTTQHKSKEISFQDAQKLNLDQNLKSPDGFEVVSGSSDGSIFSLFFGSGTDYNARYLKGNNTAIKLNITSNNDYYYNFHFLGWIKDAH